MRLPHPTTITTITTNPTHHAGPRPRHRVASSLPAPQVQRFFNSYHRNNFKIYNLCSEKQYDHSKFTGCGGLVADMPFDDHNAPPFKTLVDFCIDAHTFLTVDPGRAMSVHCKAGKGRTGTCISAYLLWAKMAPTAASALMFFAKKRTRNAQGVTIPSQRRYVAYMERYIKEYLEPGIPFPFDGKTVTLLRVRLTTLPNFDAGGG